MSVSVRIGTRGSALALAQARLAADALAAAGAPCQLVEVVTAGDRRAPDTAWGEGAFVSAIEEALLDGRVDLAVHSAKDMPTAGDPRLRAVAYLPRADARDALVAPDGATLADLPTGATIGTDSPRRAGFLRGRRPDLVIRPLHGNVDTRLRRLDAGEVDALVLAAAGLDRLGRSDRISQRLDADDLPPAPGQGAICLQARAGDERLAALGAAVDDSVTRLAVETEREFLSATGGGCRAPVGALATVGDGMLVLLGGFATLDGRSRAIERGSAPLADAADLARRMAAGLVAQRDALGQHGQVLITRAGVQAERLAARLAEHGLAALIVPAIEIRPPSDEQALVSELRRLASYSWAVVTSANGARSAIDVGRRAGIDLRAGRWAAVGGVTAAALGEAGVVAHWSPSRPRAAAVGEELPIGDGASVLLLRGSLADDALPEALRRRGAEVRSVVAYETVEAPASSRALLGHALDDGPPAAVVLASPSAVRGLLALAKPEERQVLRALPALCIGPTTSAAARAHGFEHVFEPAEQAAAALAELTAEVVASAAGARA